MISIKYDLPPLSGALFRPPSPLLSLGRFRSSSFSLGAPLPPRGNPEFNLIPYNFLPVHREKLARNTHAHARINPLPPPDSRQINGHRLLDFIEFSSSTGPAGPRASRADADPPINPVNGLALQLSRSVREEKSRGHGMRAIPPS